ncbi:hypothetical protein DAPPUDRAFT_247259 [Daphnia pulex]|uniref:Major facilitator superfamily (MFS) profile domain-containing protein n=1 Tax=Daphnia pulex TaxID=6669 RepID=E9GS37_DAPPU|nr:hypothetical protein DAPPUDRAFT_247259 [Daphnia pulex]|eukprot:EFX77638.1 hypothetical protein DAPPUDRAFT_247259 [Daphnia pulex]
MLSHVTLEPMLFLKMVAEGNVIVIADTLQIERACRVNLNFSQEDCVSMDDGDHSQIQEAVQVYQNNFSYYQSLTASLLPVLIILFAGSISDQYGRKLPMTIVLGGFVVYALIYIVMILNPSWPVEVLYAASIAVNATGSWVVFNMAVYSYLADITAVETRTKRMGWMDAVWYMGGPIGTVMGVWLYRSYGYIAVYLWARRVLGWDATEYSHWSSANEIFHQVGMVFWVGWASFYHLSNYTVAAFGLASIALWNIVLACITGPSMWWLVIIATLSGVLKASIEPALRALITTIPDKSDVGKIFAFLGLLEFILLPRSIM